MDTLKKAIGSAFDPNTDIPDLSGKVSFSSILYLYHTNPTPGIRCNRRLRRHRLRHRRPPPPTQPRENLPPLEQGRARR
jgi:hypothetical protein